MPQGIVLMVRNDPVGVEADLVAGRLTCPDCGVGVLARWGFARRRVLRDGQEFSLRAQRGRGADGQRRSHRLGPAAVHSRRPTGTSGAGGAPTLSERDRLSRVSQPLSEAGRSTRLTTNDIRTGPDGDVNLNLDGRHAPLHEPFATLIRRLPLRRTNGLNDHNV
jgi:hypothetical protein